MKHLMVKNGVKYKNKKNKMCLFKPISKNGKEKPCQRVKSSHDTKKKTVDMRCMWLRWNQLSNSNLTSVTHVYKPLWRRSVLKCFVGIFFCTFWPQDRVPLKKIIFKCVLPLIKTYQNILVFFKDKPAFMNIYAKN